MQRRDTIGLELGELNRTSLLGSDTAMGRVYIPSRAVCRKGKCIAMIPASII